MFYYRGELLEGDGLIKFPYCRGGGGLIIRRIKRGALLEDLWYAKGAHSISIIFKLANVLLTKQAAARSYNIMVYLPNSSLDMIMMAHD